MGSKSWTDAIGVSNDPYGVATTVAGFVPSEVSHRTTVAPGAAAS
ncbi:hypothetical protein [Nonomuraea sp. NPDC050786]